MERWLDNTEKGKQKHWETDLSECHFVHHKSHKDYLGSNLGLRGERPATDRLNYGKAELPLVGSICFLSFVHSQVSKMDVRFWRQSVYVSGIRAWRYVVN